MSNSTMAGMAQQLVAGTVQTVTVQKEVTKADVARDIFSKLYGAKLAGKIARKDVIGALIKGAGLTKHGAATYYQNMVTKYKEGKLKLVETIVQTEAAEQVESNETPE